MNWLWSLVIWAVIGIAAGWLAGVITGTDRNLLGDLALGLVGALVAGWVLGRITNLESGFGTTNVIISIIAAAIAAVVLVLIKDAVMGRSRT